VNPCTNLRAKARLSALAAGEQSDSGRLLRLTVTARLLLQKQRSTPHSSPRPSALALLGTIPSSYGKPSPKLTTLGWRLATSKVGSPAWTLKPRPTLGGSSPPQPASLKRRPCASNWNLGRLRSTVLSSPANKS
jgi:hypothetical protein